MIYPRRIGHIVLKVRDLERAEKFYTEVLDMRLMGRVPEWGLVFLSWRGRDHHELALFQVGKDAAPAAMKQVGLLHVAFQLENEKALEAAYWELKNKGIQINCTANHGVAKGVYFCDPDGNELELYCDGIPAEYSMWPNPYAGTEKLTFAQTDRGLPGVAEVFQR